MTKPKKPAVKAKTEETKGEKRKGAGRPTKYKPEYCQAIIEFFSVDRLRTEIKKYTTKAGTVIEEPMFVPNDIPFFSAFARQIDIDEANMLDWCDRHSEFRHAYTRAKALQKEFVVQNGIRGLYPPAAYAFTAKNITDMRDKTETEIKHDVNWSVQFKVGDKKGKVEGKGKEAGK